MSSRSFHLVDLLQMPDDCESMGELLRAIRTDESMVVGVFVPQMADQRVLDSVPEAKKEESVSWTPNYSSISGITVCRIFGWGNCSIPCRNAGRFPLDSILYPLSLAWTSHISFSCFSSSTHKQSLLPKSPRCLQERQKT